MVCQKALTNFDEFKNESRSRGYYYENPFECIISRGYCEPRRLASNSTGVTYWRRFLAVRLAAARSSEWQVAKPSGQSEKLLTLHLNVLFSDFGTAGGAFLYN